jgi:hypothetical protein
MRRRAIGGTHMGDIVDCWLCRRINEIQPVVRGAASVLGGEIWPIKKDTRFRIVIVFDAMTIIGISKKGKRIQREA